MSELLSVQARTNSPPRPGRSLKLLIVDPLPESRQLLKGALRNLKDIDSVRETGSARHIMDIIADAPVDLIMIDQNLGDESVFDVVKSLRTEPRTAGVKCVLMSSDLDTESRRKGIEVGILGYLSKPYDLNSLESAIRDSLGKVSTNHKETLNKVRRLDFFSQFTDLELVRLLKICHTRKFQAGEILFREGDHGDRLYVLIAGQVHILKRRDGNKEVLATLGVGDCFGEMALVDQEPRSADAEAATECMVIEVNAQIINDINDILALKLFRKMAILVTKKLRVYTRSVIDS
jgi:DNA-binding NarL/FixJ family response regulator